MSDAKRKRPAKTAAEVAMIPDTSVKTPKKKKPEEEIGASDATGSTNGTAGGEETMAPPVKRSRGRPAGSKKKGKLAVKAKAPAAPKAPGARGRGRPKKNVAKKASESEDAESSE